ncbi:MAG: hypothetical protein GF419_08280 [Ignavibacteriales bacterium]|nr:hypothetical protein [Ignavibacteriales bacterium]
MSEDRQRIKLKAKPRGLRTNTAYEEERQAIHEAAARREEKFKAELEKQLSREKELKSEREKGFERGEESGYAKAKTEFDQELEKLASKYAEQLRDKTEEFFNILSKLEARVLDYENAYDEIVAKTAIAVAEKVIHAQVENRSSVEEVIRAAAKKISGADEITIKINPGDYDLLESENRLDLFDKSFAKVRFEKTDKVGVGGCFIETEVGNVEARLDRQLDELARRLRDAIAEDRRT